MERRRYVRANKRIHFVFHLRAEPGVVRALVARNLSAGGLFAIYDRSLPVGSSLRIDIDFNDNDPVVVVSGIVLRCEEIKAGVHGVAIEFIDVMPGARARLQAFVEQHLNDEPLPEIERYLLPNYIAELRTLTDDTLRAMLEEETAGRA